jgi:hypothetical protein
LIKCLRGQVDQLKQESEAARVCWLNRVKSLDAKLETVRLAARGIRGECPLPSNYPQWSPALEAVEALDSAYRGCVAENVALQARLHKRGRAVHKRSV